MKTKVKIWDRVETLNLDKFDGLVVHVSKSGAVLVDWGDGKQTKEKASNLALISRK